MSLIDIVIDMVYGFIIINLLLLLMYLGVFVYLRNNKNIIKSFFKEFKKFVLFLNSSYFIFGVFALYLNWLI